MTDTHVHYVDEAKLLASCAHILTSLCFDVDIDPDKMLISVTDRAGSVFRCHSLYSLTTLTSAALTDFSEKTKSQSDVGKPDITLKTTLQ